MTLSNANEIFLGDGAIDDDFVIGRPDASPSNAEYPHGEGSATVIKGAGCNARAWRKYYPEGR